MPLLMETYKIGDYSGIQIECWAKSDLVGMHSLLDKEGCPRSENIFSDEDKVIEMDEIQRRISIRHHTNKLSSADMMLHVNDRKLLLCDAKFRLDNLKNLSKKEIDKKIRESKGIVTTDYSFLRDFYILLKKEYVRPEKISRMRRLLAGNPFCKPVSTFQFKELISGR